MNRNNRENFTLEQIHEIRTKIQLKSINKVFLNNFL